MFTMLRLSLKVEELSCDADDEELYERTSSIMNEDEPIDMSCKKPEDNGTDNHRGVKRKKLLRKKKHDTKKTNSSTHSSSSEEEDLDELVRSRLKKKYKAPGDPCAEVDEHFRKSLGILYNTLNNATVQTFNNNIQHHDVDEHFAKALGSETWSKISNVVTTAPPSRGPSTDKASYNIDDILGTNDNDK